MKIWILAAGLLSIAPLSDGMLWLVPSPVQGQASRWQAERVRLIEAAAQKPVESERAAASDQMPVDGGEREGR